MYKKYTHLEPDSITKSQKGGSVWAINLIKENRFVKLKVSLCVDGRPQMWYINNEDASYTTISLEDLLTSLVVDTHKVRDVVIFYFPGAYLNADILEENNIILNLKLNLWTSCARWTQNIGKMCVRKWCEDTKPTTIESFILFYEVCTIMVWPISEEYEITWVFGQSIL